MHWMCVVYNHIVKGAICAQVFMYFHLLCAHMEPKCTNVMDICNSLALFSHIYHILLTAHLKCACI